MPEEATNPRPRIGRIRKFALFLMVLCRPLVGRARFSDYFWWEAISDPGFSIFLIEDVIDGWWEKAASVFAARIPIRSPTQNATLQEIRT